MTNLAILIGLKALVLVAAAGILRQRSSVVVRHAALALPVGAVFGFLFHGLFHEAIPSIALAAPATIMLITVNAVFSYGLTATTVALVPIHLAIAPSIVPVRLTLYFAALLGLSAAVAGFAPTQFVKAIGAGAGLMGLMEMLALRLGRAGPIAQMLLGSPRAMGVLFVTTVVFGTAYEGFNLAFPVWNWTTLDTLPAWGRFFLMAAGGYVVLLHPMVISIRLAEQAITRRRPPPAPGSGPSAP